MPRPDRPRAGSDRVIFSESSLGWKPTPSPTEEKRALKPVSDYEKLCRQAAKTFPQYAKEDKPLDQKTVDAFNFLEWRVGTGEYNALVQSSSILGVLFAVLLFGAGYYQYSSTQDFTTLGIYSFMGLAAIIVLPTIAKSYPLGAADAKKKEILIEIPRIIGYMGMSMKLTPNLERAISFAAEHGEGKIATSFRELLWNTQTGVYSNLEEGLDEMAYNWGKFSPEFKQALMTVRSSVLEPDEVRRNALLDSALNDALESVGNKLSDQASQLKGPAMNLFYVGVLLPLILIIIIPISTILGGGAAAQVFSNPLILAGVYNVGLPILLWLVAQDVLSKRPPVYEPPEIEDSHPDLPRKDHVKIQGREVSLYALLALVAVVGLGATYFLHLNFDPSFQRIVEEKFNTPYAEYLATHGQKEVENEMKLHDLLPFILISGATITAVTVLSLHLYFTSVYKRKVQEEMLTMEEEFKDSAYLIASRLGQNKPVEDAIRYVGDFLPESILAQKVFGKVRQNITLLGLTLEGAVFDPTYGAVKNIPSKLIQSSMRIIVDAVELGVNVAARAVMALSNQLNAFTKINRQIRSELSEVNATMTSLGGFVGPIVLGITTSLQKVISDTVQGASVSSSALPQIENTSIPGFSSQFAQQTSVVQAGIDPTYFLIILLIYVTTMVTVLTYFGSSIQEGKNKLLAKIAIAKTLPVSIALFLLTSYFAKSLIGLSG